MYAYEIKDHVYNKHYYKFTESFVADVENYGVGKTAKTCEEFKKENKKNSDAVMSTINGKHYCGKTIEYIVNHKDLPIEWKPNGLNCSDCMELDLKDRNIDELALINSAGRVSSYEHDITCFSWDIEIESSGQRKVCKGKDSCKECKVLGTLMKIMEADFPYYDLVIKD